MRYRVLMSGFLAAYLAGQVSPLCAEEVSFRRDVMPILFRAGCNSGTCHGAARGKDGFHLSLFGYDPKGDYFRLEVNEWKHHTNRNRP